jgi:hypothetical protein
VPFTLLRSVEPGDVDEHHGAERTVTSSVIKFSKVTRTGRPERIRINWWSRINSAKNKFHAEKENKRRSMTVEIQTVQITLGTGNEILVILFVWALRRKLKLRFRKKK